MNKWRKKTLALFAAGIALLAGGEVKADYCTPCPLWSEPCGWDFCNMHFEIGADFIYWKPCVDDMDYAAEVNVSNTNRVHVDYKSICPDWEPGYRVYLKLEDFYCNLDLYASYTHLKSDDSSHTRFDGTASNTEGVTSPLFHPDMLTRVLLYGAAKADWEMTYQAWDVLASYDLCCTDCHKFRPYFGIAGIVLDQHLKVEFTDNPATPTDWSIRWSSDYWGVGLKAGSEYSYRFCDCLSFFAFANGTLLAGEADTKNKQEFLNYITLKDDDCCLFVPGYHIGLGFVYDMCLCNYEFGFRLGYELLEWYNLPNPRIFSGRPEETVELSHSTSPTTRTVGFHGLFAGLSLRF